MNIDSFIINQIETFDVFFITIYACFSSTKIINILIV